MVRGRLALAFSLIVATIGTVQGAAVRSWSLASAEEFAPGTLEGTAIDVDGRVALAPGQTTLWGPEEGIVWGVEPDGSGGAFVALSSPTRVVHISAAGASKFWHATGDETLAAAILPDQAGGVYVGFSPDGRLMHADGPDEMRLVADTEALFIWALAATEDGSVWIGTGLPGRLVRLDPQGELHAVFESGDDPVRCIAPLGSDGVVFGTGGRGRVIRVDGTGRPFALFDAEEAEIVALETSEAGVVYALTARGSKQVAAARAAAAAHADASVRVTATAPPVPNGDEQPPQENNGADADQRRTAGKRFTTPPGGALYRIDPDGDSRRLWQAKQDVPFALTRTEDGMLLVATGDSGRVHAVDDAGRAAVRVQIGSDQASAISLAHDGSVLVGGTTDARVARITPMPARVGHYVSPVHDAGALADWGRLRWEGDVSGGASIRAEVRSGNTAEPDETWTEWVSLKGGGSGGVETGLPRSRWFQLRMRLESKQEALPALRRLELFYRPRNRRPTITDLAVQPAGVVWSQATAQSARPAGPRVAADPVTRRTVAGLRPVAAVKPVRRSFELGARTITWKATDPDGDALSYRLDIRRDDSETWIPLAVDLAGTFFGWDARAISDGLYRVRLTAMDASDNVQGEALEDSRDSAAFWIDNTRPSVGDPRIQRSADGLDVQFVASDPGGNVVAAEVAVDAGDWRPLDPLDGVADEAEERYQLVIEPLDRNRKDGLRTLKVRVTDSAGNMGGEAWALGEER